MTINPQLQEIFASQTYGVINRSIRSLGVVDAEGGNAAAGDAAGTPLQQLATVYAALRPLLIMLCTFPMMPQPWRAAMALLVQKLEAVTTPVLLDPDFKAGKDL